MQPNTVFKFICTRVKPGLYLIAIFAVSTITFHNNQSSGVIVKEVETIKEKYTNKYSRYLQTVMRTSSFPTSCNRNYHNCACSPTITAYCWYSPSLLD